MSQIFNVFYIWCLSVISCSAFLWHQGEQQHVACESKNYTIFQQDQSMDMFIGFTFKSVLWLFKANDSVMEEQIAIKENGKPINFTEGFDRFIYTPLTGLEITNVTRSNAGLYYGVLEVTDEDGHISIFVRQEPLRVFDDSQLARLQLSLHLDKMAVKTSGEDWHVRLRCGAFPDIENAVRPLLILPSGEAVNVVEHDQSDFIYRLTNQSLPGTYTCEVISPCISQLNVTATIEVTREAVKDIILESKLQELTKYTESQKQEMDYLRAQMQQLSEANERQKSFFAAHQSERRRQEQLLFYQRQVNEDLTKENNNLKLSTVRVSFVARCQNFGPEPTYPQAIKADEVLLNQGNGFDRSTGKFTAPVDGLYFFVVTLVAHTSRQVAYFSFWVIVDMGSEQDINMDSGRDGANGFTLALQASKRLRKGQRVWIMSNDYEKSYRKFYFSGFLVTAGLNTTLRNAG